MREYLTRKIYAGIVFALAIFGTTILAVSISGTIKTWTTGEVLKSADLNTTIASLQTAIQNIPNWTKAANGTDAYYTAGNVGIGTSESGRHHLQYNGVI
jgi:type IV secretory pathway TrbL component